MTGQDWDRSTTPMTLFDELQDSMVDGRQRRLLLAAFARELSQGSRGPLTRTIEIIEELADGSATQEQRREASRLQGGRSSSRYGAGSQIPSIALQKEVSLSDVGRVLRELEELQDHRGRPTVLPETLCDFLRDIVGNPFRSIAFDTAWRTPTTLSIAKQVYDSRDFSAMPILADALQDAGCEDDEILAHCRHPEASHFRGCWVVDELLEKR